MDYFIEVESQTLKRQQNAHRENVFSNTRLLSYPKANQQPIQSTKPTSKLIDQSTNQLTNQLTNQSTNQLTIVSSSGSIGDILFLEEIQQQLMRCL